eukprot:g4604.t1
MRGCSLALPLLAVLVASRARAQRINYGSPSENGENLGIYGMLTVKNYGWVLDEETGDRTYEEVYSECFHGIGTDGMVLCEHCPGKMRRDNVGFFQCQKTGGESLVNPLDNAGGTQTQDSGGRDEPGLGSAASTKSTPRAHEHPFGKTIYYSAGEGKGFCLRYHAQMNNPEISPHSATWDLYCPVMTSCVTRADEGGTPCILARQFVDEADQDRRGYYFVFARKNLDDFAVDMNTAPNGTKGRGVVTCDLKLDVLPSTRQAQGYHLVVHVVDYYYFGFIWRGVDSCSATAIYDPTWDDDDTQDQCDSSTEFSQFCEDASAGLGPSVFRQKLTVIRTRSESGTPFFIVIPALALFCCASGVFFFGYKHGWPCCAWCDNGKGVKWCFD